MCPDPVQVISLIEEIKQPVADAQQKVICLFDEIEKPVASDQQQVISLYDEIEQPAAGCQQQVISLFDEIKQVKQVDTLAARLLRDQTLIIFDWDDTIIPTCSLSVQESMAPPGLAAPRDSYMQQAVLCVKELLEHAIRCGHTYIVTNAASGWVEESAEKWAPELLPLLEHIPILSARSNFSAACPNEPSQWKARAFSALWQQSGLNEIANVISVGDSDTEMEAARSLGLELAALGKDAFVKTIKLQPKPSFAGHLKQVECIGKKLQRIVSKTKSMELKLGSRKPSKDYLSEASTSASEGTPAAVRASSK